MNKMYAVVGMCGSGKSVVCEYLEKQGYQKIYFGGVTMRELKKEGLEVTCENEKYMREALRSKYGMGAFAYLLLPDIEEAYQEGNVILDGLYSWDEYIILKEKFGSALEMIAVVCDKNIRYERLAKRSVRPLSKEEAEKRDISEIENIAKGGPIAFADIYLYNNGDKGELEAQIEKVLRRN
jgi:dephospho-CoA kinase